MAENQYEQICFPYPNKSGSTRALSRSKSQAAVRPRIGSP